MTFLPPPPPPPPSSPFTHLNPDPLKVIHLVATEHDLPAQEETDLVKLIHKQLIKGEITTYNFHNSCKVTIREKSTSCKQHEIAGSSVMAKHSWKLITFTDKKATCTACTP